jgi:hypothetical protein
MIISGVPNSRGYLDYINVKAKRNLKATGKQTRFQFNDAANILGIGEFQVTNASSVQQIWDITDIYNTQKITNSTGANFLSKQLSEKLESTL